jgi:thiol-disulfide isomerase/thioredoxin
MNNQTRTTQHKKRQHSKKAQQQLWIWAVMAVIAIALLVVALTTSSGTQSGDAPNFTANTLAGETITLNDYRGKVVMLNFWATWCPPCRAEMPSIQAAYDQYEDRGFVVLAINNSEPASQITPFANTLDLGFPIVLDTSARLQQIFGIQGYPTSIFINAEGNVYATHTGMITPDQLTTYIETGLDGAS